MVFQVDSDKYPKVSSYTRMAALVGRFLSGVTSQLLTYFELMDYRELNYITFAGIIWGDLKYNQKYVFLNLQKSESFLSVIIIQISIHYYTNERVYY